MLTANSLGFPAIPCLNDVQHGQPSAWIPGVRVNAVDWHLLLWHSGDLRRYRDAGGDMSKAVVHWLSSDDGTIDPLWGRTSFRKRVRQMREAGVVKVIAPDFSSWADMPIAAQAYNYYRSAVVSHDLARAGFEVVPNVCWSAPQLRDVSIGMWGQGISFALIDANHFSPWKHNLDNELFWEGAVDFVRYNPDVFVWVYAGHEQTAIEWRQRFGQCLWCPSRVAVLQEMRRRKQEVQREQGWIGA